MSTKPLKFSRVLKIAVVSALFGLMALADHRTLAQEIRWVDGYADARHQAKATYHPLFVMLTEEGSASCSKLERETLTDSRVRGYLNNYVSTQINCSNGDEEKQVYKQLGGASFPTMVFLDKDGNIAYKFSGFKPVNIFLQQCQLATNALRNIRNQSPPPHQYGVQNYGSFHTGTGPYSQYQQHNIFGSPPGLPSAKN